MVRQLSEQTISPHFSTKLHETLECQLHERLSELVTSLSLDLSETTDPQRATDFSSDRDRKAVETDVRRLQRECIQSSSINKN